LVSKIRAQEKDLPVFQRLRPIADLTPVKH